MRRVLAVVSVLAASLSALFLFSSASAAPQSQSFSVPGVLDFPVPAGVTCLDVQLEGGQGGAGEDGPGNIGGNALPAATVTARVPVTPGELLTIVTGGAGAAGSGTSLGGVGYGNGGDGLTGSATNGGGGGGGSAILRGSTPLVVAGGSGGGGGAGSPNIDPTGNDGGSGGYAGLLVNGDGSIGGDGWGSHGNGGTQVAGGSGGNGEGGGAAGVTATSVNGGDGGITGVSAGGGGGGGFFGGGGGGAGGGVAGQADGNSAGGGGGGSSMGAASSGVTNVTFTNTSTGNGNVVLNWDPAVTQPCGGGSGTGAGGEITPIEAPVSGLTG